MDPTCWYCGVSGKGLCKTQDQARGCSLYAGPDPVRNDPVDSPAHYKAGKVEVIDYIEQVCSTYPGKEAPHVANAIKYISRAPLKGKKLEDLKKARWYLDRLISKLSSES